MRASNAVNVVAPAVAAAGTVMYGALLDAAFVTSSTGGAVWPQVLDCGVSAVAVSLLVLGVMAALSGVVAALDSRSTALPRWGRLVDWASRATALALTFVFAARWLSNLRGNPGDTGGLSPTLFGAGLLLAVILLWLAVHVSSLEGITRYATALVRGGVAMLGAAMLFLVAALIPKGAKSGATNPQPTMMPNVVIVVADALRARNLTLYGYGRATTPTLDELARSSIVFDRHHANADGTLSAVRSLLTGRLPPSHGAYFSQMPPYVSDRSLPALLADAGYAVGAATSAPYAALTLAAGDRSLARPELSWWTGRSLSSRLAPHIPETAAGARFAFDVLKPARMAGLVAEDQADNPFVVKADRTFARAAKLVHALPQPFLLYVHVLEPHPPFWAPAKFRGKYAGNRLAAAQLEPWTASAELHTDMYDESIEFVDDALGGFLRELDRVSPPDRTVLAVTADHGLAFASERPKPLPLAEEWVHIPLVLRVPGATSHRIVVDTQAADVAPMLLAILGKPVPPWMDGAPIALDGPPETRGPLFAFSVVKAQEERWATITSDGYKLLVSCQTGSASLFAIREDSGESRNLLPARADLAAGLRRFMAEKLERRTDLFGECASTD
jgi:arylsulfatase